MGVHAQKGRAAPGGQFHHPAQGGRQGVPHPLHGVPVNEDAAQGQVEPHGNVSIGLGPGHKGRRVRIPGKEEAHEPRQQIVEHHRRQHRIQGHHPEGFLHPQADPFQVSPAEILACIGGHGLAHGQTPLGQQHGYLGSRRISRGSGGTEQVDGRLGNHDPGGGDGKLESHGHPHPELFPGLIPVQSPVLFLRHQYRDFFQDVHQAQEHGEPLAHHRGQGRPGYSHAKLDDQQQIQPHIEAGGKHQEEQRGFAVPHGPEEHGSHVVEYVGEKPLENDGDVSPGIVPDIRRRVQQFQEPGHGGGAQKCHGSGKEQRQKGAVGYAPADPGLIPGPKPLGGEDAETGGDPQGKAQDQEHQGAGGAYGRQSPGPHIPAYDDHIRHVVQLLEHVAHEHGEKEFQDQGKDGSPGHVFLHGCHTS